MIRPVDPVNRSGIGQTAAERITLETEFQLSDLLFLVGCEVIAGEFGPKDLSRYWRGLRAIGVPHPHRLRSVVECVSSAIRYRLSSVVVNHVNRGCISIIGNQSSCNTVLQNSQGISGQNAYVDTRRVYTLSPLNIVAGIVIRVVSKGYAGNEGSGGDLFRNAGGYVRGANDVVGGSTLHGKGPPVRDVISGVKENGRVLRLLTDNLILRMVRRIGITGQTKAGKLHEFIDDTIELSGARNGLHTHGSGAAVPPLFQIVIIVEGGADNPAQPVFSG